MDIDKEDAIDARVAALDFDFRVDVPNGGNHIRNLIEAFPGFNRGDEHVFNRIEISFVSVEHADGNQLLVNLEFLENQPQNGTIR